MRSLRSEMCHSLARARARLCKCARQHCALVTQTFKQRKRQKGSSLRRSPSAFDVTTHTHNTNETCARAQHYVCEDTIQFALTFARVRASMVTRARRQTCDGQQTLPTVRSRACVRACKQVNLSRARTAYVENESLADGRARAHPSCVAQTRTLCKAQKRARHRCCH